MLVKLFCQSLVVVIGRTQNCGFLQRTANELQTNGQSLAVKTTRDGNPPKILNL